MSRAALARRRTLEPEFGILDGADLLRVLCAKLICRDPAQALELKTTLLQCATEHPDWAGEFVDVARAIRDPRRRGA